MPRVKWCTPPPPKVSVAPPDMVRDLFKRYQRAQKISDDQLAARLGTTRGALKDKRYRGTWTAQDIKRWCAALNITDAEAVGKAVLF